MVNEKCKDPKIVIAFAVKNIPMSKFTEILTEIRYMTIISTISFLNNTVYENKYREKIGLGYTKLEHSYMETYRMHRKIADDIPQIFKSGIHGIHYDYPYAPFEQLFFTDVFKKWLESNEFIDVYISEIRTGSIELVLSISALLSCIGIPYDYSLTKDVIVYIFYSFCNIFHHQVNDNNEKKAQPKRGDGAIITSIDVYKILKALVNAHNDDRIIEIRIKEGENEVIIKSGSDNKKS